jgi:hypothetical protein
MTKKNTEALVFVTKATGLEGNVDKTKYMVMSGVQNAGGSHNIKINNKPFKGWNSSNIWEPNPNFIQEEIKSRLQSGNACYSSVQNLLSSGWLFKDIKSKICRTFACCFAWV